MLDIRSELRRVIRTEADGLLRLVDGVDGQWEDAVRALATCQGKVVVVAVGKSGHVGKKIAASMASLGTPAFFVHATEAAHGDLGMIDRQDVLIAISNSGRTAEVVSLLPALKQMGCAVIAITARRESPLGRAADYCLELGPLEEADRLNLAPTVSSTGTLAIGDALAVAAATLKGFCAEDFAFRHPGGPLGVRARADATPTGGA